MLETPPLRSFTRAEIERLIETDALEGARIELLDGELIDKMGQNPPHISGVHVVLELLLKLLPVRRIRVQSSINLSAADRERNFPEPDLAVLVEAKSAFLKRLPFGHELLLAVEVADSSLSRDPRTKRNLYARAGIPEYWVVDVVRRRVTVHRTPRGGLYRNIFTLSEPDLIAPETHPDSALPVAEIFPEESPENSEEI
jgi:Uma2 family endonuclease